MGLFRIAAVVALGVSLLPADPEKQKQLYERAASAATWTLTFCDRNAELCSKAETAWSEFAKKAEFGAKLAYDVMRDQAGDDSAAGGLADGQGNGLSKPARFDAPAGPQGGTLTPDDMQPAWRGKTASKAGI